MQSKIPQRLQKQQQGKEQKKLCRVKQSWWFLFLVQIKEESENNELYINRRRKRVLLFL